MRNILKTFFAVTFTLFLFSVSTLACVCVRDKIKANGFSGQVFAVSEANPNFKEPFPQATIKLSKRTNKLQLILVVTTDESGRFSLENIKAGKYILEASAPNFYKVLTEIRIVVSSSRKKDVLEIGLEPGITCCAGYAKVLKAKRTS